MKTMKALLILLAGAGFATPVFGASDSRCISAAFADGHVEIRNKCNRDVHYLYCVVNPDASSKAYDCAGGGGSGRLAAGTKAALKVASRKGTKKTFRWFACANPRIAEKWDSMGNRGICRNPGASAAAPGSTRDDRRALQTALKTEGFNPGPADGIFGSGTRAAIKAWQQSIGQAATGQLTTEQMRQLLPRRQWAQAAVVKPAAGGTWESQAQESGDGCPGDVTVGTYRYLNQSAYLYYAGYSDSVRDFEAFYTGELCNGKPNGKGAISISYWVKRIHTQRQDPWVIYQGEVQNGRPNGNGTYFDRSRYKDDAFFSGEWREGLPVKGKVNVGSPEDPIYKQMYDGPNCGRPSALCNYPDLWNLLKLTTCDSRALCYRLTEKFISKSLSKSWQYREDSGYHYVGE